ncbi:MAG: hypothetical protein FWD61_05545 [Phycisphaerales bacterium]|nr:hypothetical protein [Phycisphaerales bacterium]
MTGHRLHHAHRRTRADNPCYVRVPQGVEVQSCSALVLYCQKVALTPLPPFFPVSHGTYPLRSGQSNICPEHFRRVF